MSVSDGRAQTETSETIEQLKERTHDIVPHFQTGSWTLATNWRDPHGPDCPACFADSLLGRLTTAETEREGYKSAEQSWMATAQLNERRFRAAEARVEAAEQALRDIIAADSAPFRTAEGMAAWTDSIARDYFARAALACPPQQPQKAGE